MVSCAYHVSRCLCAGSHTTRRWKKTSELIHFGTRQLYALAFYVKSDKLNTSEFTYEGQIKEESLFLKDLTGTRGLKIFFSGSELSLENVYTLQLFKRGRIKERKATYQKISVKRKEFYWSSKIPILNEMNEWKQPVSGKRKKEVMEIKNKENSATTSECSSKEFISVFLNQLRYKIQNRFWAIRKIHRNILSKIKHIYILLWVYSTMPLKFVWEKAAC